MATTPWFLATGNITMTYNFDPDRWYDIEYENLERLLKAGRIGRDKFEQLADQLYQRYLRMWQRLDGTYRLPET